MRWLIADTRYIQREIKAIISIDIYIIFAIILSLIFKTISNIIPLTNIIRIIITIINQAILFLTPSSIADIIMNRLNEKIESFYEEETEKIVGKSEVELFKIALEIAILEIRGVLVERLLAEKFGGDSLASVSSCSIAPIQCNAREGITEKLMPESIEVPLNFSHKKALRI